MAKGVFISSLFTKARWGVALAFVLYFVESIAVVENLAKDNADFGWASHLFYSFSMAYISETSGKTIVALEKMRKGLKFDTTDVKHMSYSFNMTIIGSLIWSIIFFLLGIYLEQIKPKEFGLYRHPFYLCKKST
jgi:hypothetical protein